VNYWGKIIGAFCGYLFGAVLGAVLGLIIGHILDKTLRGKQPLKFIRISTEEMEQIQPEFITAVFSIMGYISRCMTRDEDEEVQMVKHLMDRMNLSIARRGDALRLFNQGKQDDFPLQNIVGQFYIACRHEPSLLEMFVEVQLYAAFYQARMTPLAKQIILNICYQLDFAHTDYDRIEQLVKKEYQRVRKQKHAESGGVGLESAYAILNTTPSASDAEIKAAYRRMTSKHHPDKLVAQGLPDEILKMSEAKTREIRAAYERIREVRHF